ncbi:putative late blight resistance protein -like protein R1A-10-like [Capsicum annuum]|nr:putative late blight resistance protein -like protein R1A-10-like [Capsicum annuum]
MIHSEKRKKVLHNKKVKRLSQAILPMKFKNKIQELGLSISEVSLVIEKPLSVTDLSKKHLRLSIPLNQVLNPEKFLTTQEKEILNTKDSREKWSQIKFNLIEPSLEKRSIHLAKWLMNSSFNYVLLNNWKSVYTRNKLKVDMMIQ